MLKPPGGRDSLNLSDISMAPLLNGQEISSINLPNQTDPVYQVAIDIGGSLVKIVYFDRSIDGTSHCDLMSGRKGSLELDNRAVGGRLHFEKFETCKIDDCIAFIKERGLHLGPDTAKKVVLVTGGGAIKYSKLLEEELGVTLAIKDEMDCLIMGLNFFLHNVPFESYTFDPNPDTPNPRSFVPIWNSVYPYLLVQIGSGVSVLKIDDEHTFTRVDGSSLGGGTFWGLCSLLTGHTEFDAMLELASRGDNREVDLVVGDIYGVGYSKIGLDSDVLASSFGKIMYSLSDEASDKSSIKTEDMALSLLLMISNNIAQIAYLNAMRLNVKHIYFGGFFIRDHPITMAKISFGVNYWSKGTMQALFLLHEGYLGAVGAFLKNEKCDKIFSPFRRTRERAERLNYEDFISPRLPHRSYEQPIVKGSIDELPAPLLGQEEERRAELYNNGNPTDSNEKDQLPRSDEEDEEGVGIDNSDWVQRIDQQTKALFNFPSFHGNARQSRRAYTEGGYTRITRIHSATAEPRDSIATTYEETDADEEEEGRARSKSTNLLPNASNNANSTGQSAAWAKGVIEKDCIKF